MKARFLLIAMCLSTSFIYTEETDEPDCCCEEFPAYSAPETPPNAPPNYGPDKGITLSEVVASVLQYQWDIQISQENIARQKGVVQQNAGPFDPVLDVNFKQVGMTHVQIEGLKSNEDGYTSTLDLALTRTNRIGTKAVLGAEFQKIRNPLFLITNVVPTNELNTSNIFFEVDQPLLRRFIDNPEYIQEQVSYLELEAVKYDFVQTIAERIREAVNTYWDLVGALQDVWISRDSQDRLNELLDDTIKLIKGGEFASVETYQQYAEIFLEESNEFLVRREMNTAYQQLLYEMGLQSQYKRPSIDLNLENFISVIRENGLYSLPTLVGIAWKNRPDLQSAELRTEEAKLLLKSAINATLPELNVKGGVNVINSQINRRFPNGHLGDKAKPFFSSVNNRLPEIDVSISLNFSYPLYNDDALGLKRQREAEVRQAILVQDRLAEQIRSQVTDAYQNRTNIIKEVEEAEESVHWFHETITAERKRLKEGFSTIFIIVDFERRLNQARQRLVEAQKSYSQNFIDLLYLTGTLAHFDERKKRVYIANVQSLDALKGDRGGCP